MHHPVQGASGTVSGWAQDSASAVLSILYTHHHHPLPRSCREEQVLQERADAWGKVEQMAKENPVVGQQHSTAFMRCGLRTHIYALSPQASQVTMTPVIPMDKRFEGTVEDDEEEDFDPV